MKYWLVGIGLVVSAQAAVIDQAAFRGSLGVTSTSSYLTDAYNKPTNPTNNSVSYGIGAGYRLSSGFFFELDYIGSSNKYNLATLNNACTGSSCTYIACTNNFSDNPVSTTCTGSNMAAPATTTGSQVVLTGTTTTKGTASSTTPTTTTTSSGATTTTTTSVNYTGTSSSTTDANSGYLSVSSLMLNTIYQFSPETKLNPYIGYGFGYVDSTAGFGITTTPTNTTITSITNVSTTNGVTTTQPTTTLYVSSVEGDQAVQTLTDSTALLAYQVVLGTEIRLDVHNTIDLRAVQRYIQVPDATALVANGTPYPSIGITTTTNGVTTTTVKNISASTLTFEVGLLYYV